MIIMKKRFTTDSGGQVMIEAIVAISLVLVGLLGIVQLLIRSVGINKDLSGKLVASYLAAEGVEVVKSLIDTDIARGRVWNFTIGDPGLYKFDYRSDVKGDSGDDLVAYSPPDFVLFSEADGYGYAAWDTPTGFQRWVEISEAGPAITVKSFVKWDSRTPDRAIEVVDVFYKWRN